MKETIKCETPLWAGFSWVPHEIWDVVQDRHHNLVSIIDYYEEKHDCNRKTWIHIGAKYTIIHYDVKTTNIILDKKWIPKVSTFRVSKTNPMLSHSNVSTIVKSCFIYMDKKKLMVAVVGWKAMCTLLDLWCLSSSLLDLFWTQCF